ncbi:hypothetical protein ACH40F_32550 [Streptomyces sp. NPDC020794]|uniref:hypothetical protein n=1 Tax=unclassified Streptomyces TaxID=2593676 RepID=UPI0036E8FD22
MCAHPLDAGDPATGGWGADTVHLPDTPRGGLGTAYLTTLHTYLNSTNSELQGGAA